MNNITEIVLKTPEGEQVFLLGEKLYTDTNSIEMVVKGKTSDGRDRKNITTGTRSLTIGQLNKNGGWQTIIGGQNNIVPHSEIAPCGDIILGGTGNFLSGSGSYMGGNSNKSCGGCDLVVGMNNLDWFEPRDLELLEKYKKGEQVDFKNIFSGSVLFGKNIFNKSVASLIGGESVYNYSSCSLLVGKNLQIGRNEEDYYNDAYECNTILGKGHRVFGKTNLVHGEVNTTEYDNTTLLGSYLKASSNHQHIIGYSVTPNSDVLFSVGFNFGVPDVGTLEIKKDGSVIIKHAPEAGTKSPVRAIDLESYTNPVKFYNNIEIPSVPIKNYNPVRMVDIITKTFDAQFKSLRIQDAPATYESPIRKGDITVDNSRYQNFDVGFNSVVLKGKPTDNKHAVPKEYVDNAIKNIPVAESVDVKINGTSIVKDGVANIPYATNQVAGVMKVNTTNGVWMDSNGNLRLANADYNQIVAKQSKTAPLAPYKIDDIVRVGITTNAQTLTDQEKTNAQAWLGLSKQYTHNITFLADSYEPVNPDDNTPEQGDYDRTNLITYAIKLRVKLDSKKPIESWDVLKDILLNQEVLYTEPQWVDAPDEDWSTGKITYIREDLKLFFMNNDSRVGFDTYSIADVVAEDNGTSTSVIVDKTLTTDGAAADAKAVGDKLESKLDKVTEVSRISAYAVNPNGEQEMVLVNYDVLINAIPRWNARGCLSCTAPVTDSNTANKKYVDDLVASAGGGGKLYRHDIECAFAKEWSVDPEDPDYVPYAGSCWFSIISSQVEKYTVDTVPLFNGLCIATLDYGVLGFESDVSAHTHGRIVSMIGSDLWVENYVLISIYEGENSFFDLVHEI